jgi:hypothetical protein
MRSDRPLWIEREFTSDEQHGRGRQASSAEADPDNLTDCGVAFAPGLGWDCGGGEILYTETRMVIRRIGPLSCAKIVAALWGEA